MKDCSRRGMAALALLTAACRSAPETEIPPSAGPPIVEKYVDQRLVWLARHQNEDGSWGAGPSSVGGVQIDRPGITGLAVAAFLGAGYSHLSKDDHEEVRFSETVKRGVKWLMSALAPDGSFPGEGDRALHQALATWALSEAYGTTLTPVLKEPAQLSAAALDRLLVDDALWRSESRAGWAALALVSVKESELTGDWDAVIRVGRESLEPALDSKNGLQAAAGWAILGGRKVKSLLKSRAQRIASGPPDGTQADLLACLFGVYIVAACDEEHEPLLDSHWSRLKLVVQTQMDALAKNPGDDSSAAAIKASLLSLIVSARYRRPTPPPSEK